MFQSPKKPKEPFINKMNLKMMLLMMGFIIMFVLVEWILVYGNLYIPLSDVNRTDFTFTNPISGDVITGWYGILESGNPGYILLGESANEMTLRLYKAQTMGTVTLILSEMIIALECRSSENSMFKGHKNPLLAVFVILVLIVAGGVFFTPFLRAYLGFICLDIIDWIICIGLAVILLVIIEIWKKI